MSLKGSVAFSLIHDYDIHTPGGTTQNAEFEPAWNQKAKSTHLYSALCVRVQTSCSLFKLM